MGVKVNCFGIICLLFVLLYPTIVYPDTADKAGTWDIHLNTESIEHILLYPENILADPDHFWKTDQAYKFADAWHKGTRVSKTSRNYYNKWLDFLREQSHIPDKERKSNQAFQLVETLKKKMDVYLAKSVPLINDFLPDKGISYKAGIYLTTRTLPYAWVTDGNMILDPLSYKFKMDADAIFNSLTHEAFHIGYGTNRHLRREHPLSNTFVYNTLVETLQNEGMAVYIAWKAGAFFPAPEDRDYKLLADMDEVRKRFHWVNEIYAAAENNELSQKELRRKSWDLGVDQRAYYIAGAHMCRCIENKKGRKALVETIVNGPLSFIDAYNDIAEAGLTVYRFKGPKSPLLTHQLKMAVLDRDIETFKLLARKMQASRDSLESNANWKIWSIGYGQVKVKNFDWALPVFRLGAELFPESPTPWYGLADAYMEKKDLESARKYFNKVLEINPKIEIAQQMLKKIDLAEKGKE